MVYPPPVMLVSSCDNRWVSSMPAGLGILHLGGDFYQQEKEQAC